jgi:hypothetical protein
MTGTELPYGGNSQNKQDIVNNPGQAIVDMRGGVAIGQIGQLMIYFSQNPTESAVVKPDTSKLGVNPYRGLLAFGEMDGDRFFGREVQIAQLWEKFHNLHQDQSTVRVLPIYGPSGSGKSSLARAGLIPALGKKPLPGRDRARLAVLVPGTHPLEALATVLARVATNDLTPVAKSQEFEQVLKTKNDEGKYEGLRRIADALPDIAASPLIVLVDQFEEVYTYALTTDRTQRDAFIAERDALIENLLCAAAERSQRVSVIITLRSDFLGETQQHPRLNKLFSTQGFLVPIMQPEELEIAIAKPAAQAGHQLDKAIVKLLVEQTQGREGALPLLQFALTRIWEGLQNKVDAAETLHNIGGVGGALAGEAQRLYQSLKPEDQAIARSIFLALVQVSEDSGDTRRRAPVSELIPTDGDENRVWSIINKFADPGVRFLATFSDKQRGEMIEMIEVAHEALIRNWEQLKEWLKECREALRKKRKIEEAAEDWKCHKKSKDYLIEGRSLRDAREFMQGANKEITLSSLAVAFVNASVKKQRINTLKSAPILLVLLISTLIAVHLQIIARANSILSHDDCKPDFEIKGLLEYMWWTKNAGGLTDVQLCKENLVEIRLPGVYMFKTNFDLANLSRSNFRGSRLASSSFKGAILGYADFSHTLLQRADFQRKDSEVAMLLEANFADSNLSEAKFQEAYLEKANFQRTFLEGANFQGAFLKGAIFKDSNLTSVNLYGAKGLTEAQLKDAIICSTTMPDYLKNISKDRNCHF